MAVEIAASSVVSSSLSEYSEVALESCVRAMPLITCQKLSAPDGDPGFRSVFHLNEEAMKRIKASFPEDHQLVVISVAGPTGSGKSTWLNALAMRLDPSLTEQPFESGDSQTGVTKGMLVFPKPLPLGDKKSLLLCDMEGMDGLREDLNQKETSELVRRMFFVSLAVASTLCIHSPLRVPGSLIEGLKDLYEAAGDLKTTLDIEMPNFTLFVSNTNAIQNPLELKKVIQSHCNVPQDLIDLLKIEPRGRPSGAFFDTDSIQALLEGGYLTSLQSFLETCPAYTKISPGRSQWMTPSEWVSNVLVLIEAINSSDYVNKYLTTLQKRLKRVLKPEMQRLLQEFRAKVLDSAKCCDPVTDLQQFEAGLKTQRDNCIAEFEMFVTKNIRGKHQSSETVLSTKAELSENLTYATELDLFLQRHERHLSSERKSLSSSSSAGVCFLPSSASSNSSFCFQSDEPSFSQVYLHNSSRFDHLTSMINPGVNPSSISYSLIETRCSIASGPLKMDGTPDMRYKVNREAAGNTIRMTLGGDCSRSARVCDIPLKKDGTPDMRYSINKQLFGGSRRRRRYCASSYDN